jgi:hypothetical protein
MVLQEIAIMSEGSGRYIPNRSLYVAAGVIVGAAALALTTFYLIAVSRVDLREDGEALRILAYGGALFAFALVTFLLTTYMRHRALGRATDVIFLLEEMPSSIPFGIDDDDHFTEFLITAGMLHADLKAAGESALADRLHTALTRLL